MERRIASLLNSSRDVNILQNERDSINQVIEEYFLSDSNPDDETSDSEDDISPSSSVSECSISTVDPELLERNDDDKDDLDTPVVKVSASFVSITETGAKFNENIKQFSCFCTQIKAVPTGNQSIDERKGCITQFSPDEVMDISLSMLEMERGLKDMMILGMISSCIHPSPTTECTKRKDQSDRQKSRSTYYLKGRCVCTKTFLKLLCISQKKLKALHEHFKTNGLVPREIKSGGRRSRTKSLTSADSELVFNFLKLFAEDNAVKLPGRVPGFKREDIQLLPSSCPKSFVYKHYVQSAEKGGYRIVALSTFRKLWQELCPYIVVSRPMTDLCWRCQKNNTKIYRSANLTLDEKKHLMREHEEHLDRVELERNHYKDLISKSKETVGTNKLEMKPSPANSKNISMHYSFDFAQQVHYPSNAAQPGPIFFLTPRKCSIFGVCCEAFPKQVNFLIDEAVNCSKGSTGVISYLHYFFENYGLGEKVVHLHCDNCAGQNKNRFVLWYFAWRIMRGLHDEVTINFMPVGHTKFAPDWCFGLLKRRFRRSEVSCLDDLCQVVHLSTADSNINIPQLVGLEDGSLLVKTFNIYLYLSPAFKPLKGMLKFSHFRFTKDFPGQLFYKDNLTDSEQCFDMVNISAFQSLPPMPTELPSPGLSQERKEYLFKHIREYVREEKQDLVCPRPSSNQ